MSNLHHGEKTIVIQGNVVTQQRPGTSGVMLRPQNLIAHGANQGHQSNQHVGARANMNKQPG